MSIHGDVPNSGVPSGDTVCIRVFAWENGCEVLRVNFYCTTTMQSVQPVHDSVAMINASQLIFVSILCCGYCVNRYKVNAGGMSFLYKVLFRDYL